MRWKDLSVNHIRELNEDELKEYNKWARLTIIRGAKTYPEGHLNRKNLLHEINISKMDTSYSKALNYHYLINNRELTYHSFKKTMAKEFERIRSDGILSRHWKSKFWDEQTFREFVEFMAFAKSIYNSADLDSERLRRTFMTEYDEIVSKMCSDSGMGELKEMIDVALGFREQ